MTELAYKDVVISKSDKDSPAALIQCAVDEFAEQHSAALASGCTVRISIMIDAGTQRTSKFVSEEGLNNLLLSASEKIWQCKEKQYRFDFEHRSYTRRDGAVVTTLHLTAQEQLALYKKFVLKERDIPKWPQIRYNLLRRFGMDFMKGII